MAYGGFINGRRRGTREESRKHQIQPEYGDGQLNPFRETKFSGTHGNRGIFIFSVQLTRAGLATLPG